MLMNMVYISERIVESLGEIMIKPDTQAMLHEVQIEV